MTTIRFEDKTFTCRNGETVLETLERNGIAVPSSCRSGVCYICLLRRTSGETPPEVDLGLKESLRSRGYFLACKSVPSSTIEVARPLEADLFSRALVHGKELLGGDVIRLLLEPATPLYYRAGQFINLRWREDLTRSYSLASVPREDQPLELHVKLVPGGRMSRWIHNDLQVGQEIDFQGPLGTSYYVPGSLEQNYLLVGTGTGLAPLVGVARDALGSCHQGAVVLYHGTRHPEGLYLHEQLQELAKQHSNFRYVPCVSGNDVPSDCVAGRADEVALADHPNLEDWRVHLAGLPAMVHGAREAFEETGAKPWEIHIDPFETSNSQASSSGRSKQSGSKRPKYPDPDPELWAAVGGGTLQRILEDFYTRVFADSRLASFFEGTTRQRAQEKQYNFLYQVLSGEKVYFGESPEQAHHWMVISDELFDYREDLFADSLRRNGLSEPLIRRWRAMHELYRHNIVKSQPRPKVVDGRELPLDGFGETILDVGTLCDSCDQEISAGEQIRYHLRTGKVYCANCMNPTDEEEAKSATATG